jgi:hypothetical protein
MDLFKKYAKKVSLSIVFQQLAKRSNLKDDKKETNFNENK